MKPLPDDLIWKYLPTGKSSRVATAYYFFVPDCFMAAIMFNVSLA